MAWQFWVSSLLTRCKYIEMYPFYRRFALTISLTIAMSAFGDDQRVSNAHSYVSPEAPLCDVDLMNSMTWKSALNELSFGEGRLFKAMSGILSPATISKVRSAGFSIAQDDFGTLTIEK